MSLNIHQIVSSDLTSESINELEQLVNDHPYFTAGWLKLLLAYQAQGVESKVEALLPKVSAMVPDRVVLKSLLEKSLNDKEITALQEMDKTEETGEDPEVTTEQKDDTRKEESDAEFDKNSGKEISEEGLSVADKILQELRERKKEKEERKEEMEAEQAESNVEESAMLEERSKHEEEEKTEADFTVTSDPDKEKIHGESDDSEQTRKDQLKWKTKVKMKNPR